MNILNKFKRGLAGLLSLSVAVSAVFVFHFPLIKAHAAEEHSHPICGGSSCSGDHDEHEDNVDDWQPFPEQPDSESEDSSYPPSSGYFYLKDDITLTETWVIDDSLFLCLNGHDITFENSGAGFYVDAGFYGDIEGELTLCDCQNKGVITHKKDVTGNGVYNFGTFYMYGGTISGNSAADNGGGVYNCNSSDFYMYGGFITGNKAEHEGGGVYNEGTFEMSGGTISNNTATLDGGGGVYNDYSQDFSMYGGEITGNTAGGNGAGVYNDGNMTVGGTVNITGNKSSGNDNNVYLTKGGNDRVIDISEDVPLRGKNTKIGVTTEVAPTKDDEDDYLHDVDIAKSTDGENYRLFFASDGKFNTSFVDGNNEGTIVLTLGESDDDEVEPKKPEDSEPDESDDSSDPTSSDSSEPSSSESSEPSTPSDSGSDDPGNNDENKHTHDNDGITWTAFDKDNPQTEKGNYYLAGDDDEVVLTNTWEPADGTRLCLNGKKLSIDGDKPVISVTGEFTLCDDEGGGIVTHGANGGVGVSVKNGGKFAIYGGTINGNNGCGVTVEDGGALTVGGMVKIFDGVELLDGQKITVSKDERLEEGAKIKVKLAAELQPGDKVAVTNTNDTNVTEFFESVNEDYSIENGKNNEVIFAKPKDGEHKHDNTEFEPIASEDELIAATEGNYYYLTKDITLTQVWTPAKNVYLCLNGKTITGTISVTESGVTLYNCKTTGTANVTVSEDKTITVGGKLKANITLNNRALIDVDSKYPLTSGASITVTTNAKPTENNPVAITGEKNSAYISRFNNNNQDYELKTDASGAIVLAVKPTTKPDDPEPGKHYDHPICGDIKCGQHSSADWTEWTSSTTLPTTKGSYYLTGNVTLTSAWKPTSDINLCLNGCTITMNGDDTAVYVTEDLSICDCSVKMLGTITHASGKTGRGVYIASGGAFTMYGGNIKGNTTSADGAGVYNDGTFDMLGGEITGNKSTNGSGGGLYNKGFAQIEGSINKNSASKKGGGVYQDGKLTVNNDAYIMYNTVGSSKSNVYLTDASWITIGSKYNGEVGVSLQTNPKSTGSVTFAKGDSISSSTVNKIKSDSSSYKIARSGDKLTLAKKSTTSSSDSDLELEISSPLASSAIPSADRTAIINLLKDMPNWVVGTYYDVTLWEDDDEIDDAGESLTFKLTIPASIRATNREYKVIRVHDGKATVLDGTTDSSKTTITVKSRYFSTYAIIYSVSQSGVGSSGSGSNGGYGNPAMGVQNDIPLAGLACGFTVLALAAPGKKLDQ